MIDVACYPSPEASGATAVYAIGDIHGRLDLLNAMEAAVLADIEVNQLADDINLGLTRMSETCRGASLRQLGLIHDWHIGEAAYAEALARLIDAHRVLPLSSVWGDGTTSSSDGQHFFAGGRGEAIADVNARHGNEPGVSFYTRPSEPLLSELR